MSKGNGPAQIPGQAGASGKPEDVGLEVGGVHNSAEESWIDLWTLKAETRRQLKNASRDAACSHTTQRSEGPGDGSEEIETPGKVRKLQRTLYRKAKAEPKYRFWSLYGELARMDLLEHALKLVARNGGAPGIDGQTVAEVTADQKTKGQWLEALQREMQTKRYQPSPVRRVYIPKSNGGKRPLGIPTVKDRVVQMAALLVLGPIFEADFHPRSFGFRPGRNAHQALDEIVNALRSGRLEVVDADLSKYFDTIPHDRLM